VTSPTFTIGSLYEGGTLVAHLDLYRFQEVGVADWGALEPYLQGTICFVEWPEAGEGWLPEAVVRVRLSHLDERRRRIELTSDRGELVAGLI
jgi:tRNA threonylcarbamoyladenosine biosynthesis protein TsaE